MISIGINKKKIKINFENFEKILKKMKNFENLKILVKSLFTKKIEICYEKILIFFLQKKNFENFKKLINYLLEEKKEDIFNLEPLYFQKFLFFFENFILKNFSKFPKLKIFGIILKLEYLTNLKNLNKIEISEKILNLTKILKNNENLKNDIEIINSIFELLNKIMKKMIFEKIEIIENFLNFFLKSEKIQNKLILKFLIFIFEIFKNKYFINKKLILEIKCYLERFLGNEKRVIRKLAGLCLNQMYCNYNNIN